MTALKTCAIFDLDGTIIRVSSEQVFLSYMLSHGEIPIPNLLAWTSNFLKVRSLSVAKPNKIYLRGLAQQRLHEIARRCFVETLRPSIAPHIAQLIHAHPRRRTDGYSDVGFVVVPRSTLSRAFSNRLHGCT